MRVLHIITRLIVGGAQENTIASVLGLNEMPGLAATLASGPTLGSEGSLEHVFSNKPGTLMRVPHLVRPVNPWQDALAYRELRALITSHAPDVVHTHSGKAGILGRLAAAACGVPVIVHTIHGPSFGAFQSAAANVLFKTAEQIAAKVTTHFVVVAEAMRQQYLQAGIGSPAKYTTIYSGFDLKPFVEARNSLEARARLGIPADALVIGKIARLFELKGHDDLLEIGPNLAEQVPSAVFLFVGDGPSRQRLECKARALGIASRCFFAGLVPPGEVPSLAGVMDVLAHLSRREGLARALPQALAAARPVVAYDCDGAAEVCVPGRTGFLVRPGDREELLRSLVRLCRDPELRRNFGETGQRMVQERFQVQGMVQALAALYRHLLGARNGDSHKTVP